MPKSDVTPAEMGEVAFVDEISLPSFTLIACATPENVRGLGTRKVGAVVISEFIARDQTRYVRCYNAELGAVRWYRAYPKEKSNG